MDARNPLTILESMLRDLLPRRDSLNREIAGLEQAIEILKPVYGDDVASGTEITAFAELGITDAVRETLRAVAPNRLTAMQVRDALVKSGFDLSEYSNPMAIIHQVLRRLIDAGQVVFVSSPESEKALFEWVFKSTLPPSLMQRYGTGTVSIGKLMQDLTAPPPPRMSLKEMSGSKPSSPPKDFGRKK